MRTINDVLKSLYIVAFDLSKGYKEFSHMSMQTWTNGFHGTRIVFEECTIKYHGPELTVFSVKIPSKFNNIEFVDSRNSTINVNGERIVLEEYLHQEIDDARLPMQVKRFLRELDDVCIGIIQRSFHR